ncbi:hypothetical protein HY626_01440 [Candidatus Uhrbacteria bacterium]|nr:hypothetical protein [Candidatus Uhrbacteria bacterium]
MATRTYGSLSAFGVNPAVLVISITSIRIASIREASVCRWIFGIVG